MARPRHTLRPRNVESDFVLLGILCMCSAHTIFPLLNTAVQYLIDEYPILQLVWARYVGHLVYILAVLIPTRGFRFVRTTRPKIQLVRSLLLVAATAFYFSALIYIPLATAAVINFTGPMIMVALSIFVLGETVGPRRWVAVILGFIGAMIIIRPGLGGLHWGGFLVLGCAACNSLYQILTRSLAGHDSAETSIFYTALVPSILLTLLLPFDYRLPGSGLDWLLFSVLGLIGGLGHYLVIKAYENAEASIISPLNYVQLVGATALGYFVFGDFPDVWTWVGAAIIVASGLYIMHRETIHGRGTKQAGDVKG
ncbi:MAG: EamA family transporter [Alphaproteobacteria bacterium]|nr:EamA family transporter [Alphaproteobacteria bacterium]|tara:strand:+ start:2032 stop:2964 length:933 start_codon:yes stop_codon:yes gene_type:complete